jgi:hypothetical protein
MTRTIDNSGVTPFSWSMGYPQLCRETY